MHAQRVLVWMQANTLALQKHGAEYRSFVTSIDTNNQTNSGQQFFEKKTSDDTFRVFWTESLSNFLVLKIQKVSKDPFISVSAIK